MSLADARAAAIVFEPQRLRIARQLRKMNRVELARQVEVSAAAVGQWEAGEVRPKPHTLQTVADALSFPVAYFGSSGRTIAAVDTQYGFFRSLLKSKQIDRDAAMAGAGLLAQLVEVIERHASLPVFDIPLIPVALDAADKEIDAIAWRVRELWDLDAVPIADMVRQLEKHGTVLSRLEMADDVDAFSWPCPARPIVILGTDREDKARSRLSAAHELAHLVMHRDHPKPGDRTLEKQAFRFASAFLVPPDQLAAEWPGRISWRNLLQLKHRWGISLAALLYRAREEQLMTPTTYESAMKYMSRLGWRRAEPGDLGPPEEPALLRLALETLQQTGITETDLAAEAHIPLAELRRFLFGSGTRARVQVKM